MTLREIRTLLDFEETHRAIHAYCSHHWVCSHDAQLVIGVLASHLGWQFDFYAGRDHLAGRLRCSICGWYYPNFALGHAGKRPEFSGTHGAGTVAVPTDELIDLQRARQANIAVEMPWIGKRKGGRKFGR